MGAHPADNWRTVQVLTVMNYVFFTVMDCTSEITPGKKYLFLSEEVLLAKVCNALLWISTQRALVRTMVHLDLKIHTEINHGNSKTVSQRIRFMQHSTYRKICLGKEPPWHGPGETQEVSSRCKSSSRRLEEPALPLGAAF